jgi:PAS domain S-box-containing protein
LSLIEAYGFEQLGVCVVPSPFKRGNFDQRGRQRISRKVNACVLCLLLSIVVKAQDSPVRRVAILYENGTSYPATELVDDAIQESLRSSGQRVQIYREYMETSLFPDPADQKHFRESFLRRYTDRKPDVFITMGSGPLKFMSAVHDEYFPGIPTVFSVPNGAERDSQLGADFTGVTRELRAAETVNAALKLLPDTKHIFVIAGSGRFEKQQLSDVQRQLRLLKDRVEINTVEDLKLSELQGRLSRLPSHSIVLFTSFSRDPVGTPVTSRETGPLVSNAANAPVFVLFDVYLNHGEVGGDVCNIADQGRVAGNMAMRILNGEKASGIPRAVAANSYVFDLRAMHRWGLKVRDLPPGSLLLNRPVNIWEAYKRYIVLGVLLLLLESLLILALLRNQLRRKRAETELSETYERLRLALNSAKSIAWELRIHTRKVRLFGDMKNVFGNQSAVLEGELRKFRHHVYRPDRSSLRGRLVQAIRSGEAFRAEFRLIREDGSLRWIAMRGALTNSKDEGSRAIRGIAIDITDLKAAEEALTSLSGRLITSQEDERRRIAREIHDDCGQVIAVLSIDLQHLSDKLFVQDQHVAQQVHDIRMRLNEIGNGLRSLSHSLHSSTLELIGLVGGLRSLCDEFTHKHALNVTFSESDVPAAVPVGVALCLFRITQEALQNSKKHGKAKRVEVSLRFTAGDLRLRISDDGVGFDPLALSQNAGIGLRSMEERLRLIGGRLEVLSQRGRGTRISASVPYQLATVIRQRLA